MTSTSDAALSTVNPTVAIFSTDASYGRHLARALATTFPDARICDDGANAAPLVRDVAIVNVAHADYSALIHALRRMSENGFPELVFVVEHRGDPEAEALRALGAAHIVSRTQVEAWLRTSLPFLADLARARATFRRIAPRVACEPSELGAATLGKTVVGLYESERRFRETYIRSLLGLGMSRREAASVAGVPYRTFSEMLAKLDIKMPRGLVGLGPIRWTG